jgi:hypothetical protein
VTQPTRGIRNNNPGNIRLGQPWQGLAAAQTDPEFCVFIGPQWGIRAIVRILDTYQREGVHTIADAISHWAPPSDSNPTSAYIHTVCVSCGVGPTDLISLADYMLDIVQAIIQQENGSQPYTDDLINLSIKLAGN